MVSVFQNAFSHVCTILILYALFRNRFIILNLTVYVWNQFRNIAFSGKIIDSFQIHNLFLFLEIMEGLTFAFENRLSVSGNFDNVCMPLRNHDLRTVGAVRNNHINVQILNTRSQLYRTDALFEILNHCRNLFFRNALQDLQLVIRVSPQYAQKCAGLYASHIFRGWHNHAFHIFDDISAAANQHLLRNISQYFSGDCPCICNRNRFCTPHGGHQFRFQYSNICIFHMFVHSFSFLYNVAIPMPSASAAFCLPSVVSP